jgi:predicted ATPase
MLPLRAIEWKKERPVAAGFPFNVPVMQTFTRLAFDSPITFLVGENGSGKSTFLEAMACAVDLPAVGEMSVRSDPTLADMRRLADYLKLVWNKKTGKGLFMRAEDFFGFAKRMAQIRVEYQDAIAQVDRDYEGRSELAKGLARMPYSGEISAMKRAYGEGLDANSHGEGFLKLFQARFVGEGLYLLDEPEAPLSPTRQLTLLTMMKLMVDRGAQLVIATHSPILLAFPGATILSCDGGRLQPVDYETLDHVQVTRSFLNNPESYLKHLLAEERREDGRA